MRAKPKFLKHMIIFAFIPLILSIGLAPAMSFAASHMVDSPRKQMAMGVDAKDVICNSGLALMIKFSGSAACVKDSTAKKLEKAGWGTVEKDVSMMDEAREMMMEEKEMMEEEDMMEEKEMMEEEDMMEEKEMMEEYSGLSGEVTIGLILPLTGDLATHGIENHEGSKYGVVEFNKHLEEIGASWHLKMVSEDSATNPVIALEKLTSLNAKGIGIVVGPETSSNIRNIKGYSDSNNMLLVSCCSSAPALAIPNDSVFRLVPDDRNQGAALAKLMQHEGIEVLVPVWRGDTWGDGLSEASTGSFIERGGIADEGIRYNPESPEFSASTSLLAEKVQGYVDEYGADKVAILFLGFAEILQFTQSASEHDVLDDLRWFGPGANTKEHRLIEDPIGLEFSTNVQFTTVQFAASKNPIYERVQEHLTETLGTDPNTFVHSSYDAVWVIGLAMLETQSTDVGTIKAAIPEIAENYSGAIGPTKLNEAGDLAQADYEVWGIRGGEWVLLGKYTQSDDSVTLL